MLGITHASAAQRGFTLIEMSIVLVIIGLIIGGILKGQEIIESSRQKNVITQIDAVRSAVNTFADKYNALPGDYGSAATRISGNLVDGDDSGIIGEVIGDLETAPADAEQDDFFNHLSGAELLSGTTINGATGGFGDGNAWPAVAIPAAGMTMMYGQHSLTGATAAQRRSHWLRVHKNPTTAIGDTVATGAFTGKSLFQIDLKVDDSNGATGSVRVQPTPPAATCSNATGTYVALANNQDCAGYFELLQ